MNRAHHALQLAAAAAMRRKGYKRTALAWIDYARGTRTGFKEEATMKNPQNLPVERSEVRGALQTLIPGCERVQRPPETARRDSGPQGDLFAAPEPAINGADHR